MPNLCSSFSIESPGKERSTTNAPYLIAIHLGKDDVHLGQARIRNPHLGAVKYVAPAIVAQGRFGAHAQGIGAGLGFTEAIGGEPFAGRQFGQVLGLGLRRAEVDDRHRANARVRRTGDGKRAGAAELFLDEASQALLRTQPASTVPAPERRGSRVRPPFGLGHRSCPGFFSSSSAARGMISLSTKSARRPRHRAIFGGKSSGVKTVPQSAASSKKAPPRT